MDGIFQKLDLLDLLVIIAFFSIIIGIAVFYSKKAGKDTGQFFLSGRNLPWYLSGTAMVATTFAADTPLAVTELVAKNGIAGNWIWWNMAIGGLLTVFFFARLWRRSGLMTDLELIEMRYSGKPAAILRGFRAIYLGLFMNAIVIAWVHKAMEKIFLITLPGIDPFWLVVGLAILVTIYASASGLLGTIRTDSFQFVFALAGCIILAIIVVKLPEIGSMENLANQVSPEILDFFPTIQASSTINKLTGGALALTIGAFIAYVGIQWWSSWYPGADPGGGGYIAQRMLSAKDEKHSLLATLWFNIAHYTLRPWPWIIVALAALVILPRAHDKETLKKENPVLFNQVEQVYKDQQSFDPSITSTEEFKAFYEKYENTVDPGVMYPKLMVRYLPKGLLGLLLAVFLAAYMSTIAAQINLGTSYLVNDFYKRFIRKSKSEQHYVAISRLIMFLLILFSLMISRFFLSTISGAWEFILNLSAGLGSVLILRWFWWRVNAWSEIIAMLAPFLIYPAVKYGFGMESPITLFPIAIGTTIIWIAVTFITKPEDDKILNSFYRKIAPGGIGWKKYAINNRDIKSNVNYKREALNWIFGTLAIYSALYGTGKLIFGQLFYGFLGIALTIGAAMVIYYNVKNHQKYS